MIPFSTQPIPGAHYQWYSTAQQKAAAREALLGTVQRRAT